MPLAIDSVNKAKMEPLGLHDFHEGLKGQFVDLNGREAVGHYGNALAEHKALCGAAGVLDLSFRGRLCLIGVDRQNYLNGQVSNNVKPLRPYQGCYAALLTPKGRMESDMNIHCLENEILLDFEPGLSARVASRLEKFIIADDVTVVDVASLYGLLSVQGPKAAALLEKLQLGPLPSTPMASAKVEGPSEIYVINLPRTGTCGFDLFAPAEQMQSLGERLIASAHNFGGRACGWQALELARIEAGIPRFGADMDQTTLPPEAGIVDRAVSYKKGCYVGQEIIARLRVHGQPAKILRGIRLPKELKTLPVKGDRLFYGGQEAGWITSAIASPKLGGNLALGYVRRAANAIGTEVSVQTGNDSFPANIVELPFR